MFGVQSKTVPQTSSQIHPTALVSPKAQLGAKNQIGPFVCIEDDVILGEENHVLAHAVLKSGTRMGNRNSIHEHAIIGGVPQDLKFQGKRSFVKIGEANVLREGVTLHRGSREDSSTVIGDGNLLMAYAHVAHDCRIGNGVILANNVALAGDVELHDRCFLSGAVVVHQFARVGSLSMVGGSSKITQDVLPFSLTDGNPARTRGVNQIGLRRAGFSAEDKRHIKQAFRLLIRSGLVLKQAQAELKNIPSKHVQDILRFIENTKRGFHR